MANRWRNNDRLYFLGFKITENSEYSYETKKYLLLGRKIVKNIDSALRSRDVTFLTKVHVLKTVIFPVVMNACESSTIKKAEH